MKFHKILGEGEFRRDVLYCKKRLEMPPNNSSLHGLFSLHWRHKDHDGVSNHQPHGCLLNRSFGSWWKKTSKLRFTGLCVGNSPGPENSPHKGPVTRKMFPFDDVIMYTGKLASLYWTNPSTMTRNVISSSSPPLVPNYKKAIFPHLFTRTRGQNYWTRMCIGQRL